MSCADTAEALTLVICTALKSTSPGSIPQRYIGQPTPYTHQHLLRDGEITPGISTEEFKRRRRKLMSSISKSSMYGSCPHHVAVILAADTKYMTDEIPYPFRQNTDFLYLCGFQEPMSALVLESLPDRALPDHKATLFVPQRDPDRELWDGPRAGIDGALNFIGVDEAHVIGDLSEFLHQFPSREKQVVWYDVFRNVNDHLHKDVVNNLVMPCRNKGHTVNILQQILHSMRVIKSPAEMCLMRESCRVASEAFVEVMRFTKPGINEAHLYAKVDFEVRLKGAEFLAYPPVVAGGNRANTLHYVKNNQSVEDGDLILMDAGCEYHGYASDITRTWPVNGRFSESQASLYQAVLDVQKECLEMCEVGNTLDQMYRRMLEGLGQRLQHLGIVPKHLNDLDLLKVVKKYCPHHLGHYLGMDTHDTPRVSRSNQLQAGMVITVEPGLYLPASDKDVPPHFRGMGVRIEDDVLITDGPPDVLTAECPKEMVEIENIMN
ncbi:xaa-Pro aminopeptidase 3-like [Diadema antillarum]|uniref:xaa-Pro aminopeptidase 3-like n=1 Tax=Diadema antillarum TaxID=105358 RepID=UPI003A872F23